LGRGQVLTSLRLAALSSAPGSELAPGLEAGIHDPLWLLGRQWQHGEFAAADGGSAIVAQVSASVAPLTRLRPGRPSPTARTGNYVASAVPLETIIEADDIHAAPTARMRVRAGQHFERLLAARNLGQYAAAYRTAYPIAAAPDAPDAASRRFLTLVAGRAIDGERLYRDFKASLRLTPPALPAAPDRRRRCGRRARCRAGPGSRGPMRSSSRPRVGRRDGCRTASSTRSR